MALLAQERGGSSRSWRKAQVASDRWHEDGLRPKPDGILFRGSLGHAGAVGTESIDVLLIEVCREQPGDGQADSILRESDEELRESSRDVRHLQPERDRAFTQIQSRDTVVKEALVPTLERPGVELPVLRHLERDLGEAVPFARGVQPEDVRLGFVRPREGVGRVFAAT